MSDMPQMNSNRNFSVPKKSVYITLVILLLIVVGGVFYMAGKSQATIAQNTNTQQPSQQGQLVHNLNAQGPSIGSGPINIIEYSDYQCPFCRVFYNQTEGQLLNDYQGKIKLIYKDFPLQQLHPQAYNLALAAQCVYNKYPDKYWEVHNTFFDEQQKINPSATATFTESDIYKWLGQVPGVDVNAMISCIRDKTFAGQVDAEVKEGSDLGVTGTPTFFIGNEKIGYVPLPGAYPYSVFKQVIDQELNQSV